MTEEEQLSVIKEGSKRSPADTGDASVTLNQISSGQLDKRAGKLCFLVLLELVAYEH